MNTIKQEHIVRLADIQMGVGRCIDCGKKLPIDVYDECPYCGQDLVIAFRAKDLNKLSNESQVSAQS